MDITSDIRRIRRQRNFAMAAGGIVLAVSLAVSAPLAIARRSHLKKANAEILMLEQTIRDQQKRIIVAQRQIVTAQEVIRTTLNGRH